LTPSFFSPKIKKQRSKLKKKLFYLCPKKKLSFLLSILSLFCSFSFFFCMFLLGKNPLKIPLEAMFLLLLMYQILPKEN
jgi:hypothetical protein